MIEPRALALLNQQMVWEVEPGEFELMVGGSSAHSLSARFNMVPAG
jgi:hypothetical protein